MNKDKSLALIIYSLLLTGLVIGIAISSPRVITNYKVTYPTNTFTQDYEPICSGCYFSKDMPSTVLEGSVFTVSIKNLAITHSYLLVLQDKSILFTSNKTEQYFYSNTLQTKDGTILIYLFEVFTNPFFFKFPDIMDNLILLDQWLLAILDISV